MAFIGREGCMCAIIYYVVGANNMYVLKAMHESYGRQRER